MYWLMIVTLCLAADLGSVKTEVNPERRSELALDYANTSIDAARDAYSAGDAAKTERALNEVGQSVELAFQSLEESGKNARNNKYFKRAELRTRELMRRIDGLRESVSFDDRALIDKLRDRVIDVHDELLKSIMGKKK